jgi:signal transduction histidine kinase
VTTAVRVLMVEDSDSDAKLIVRELQRMGRPVDVERVETAEAMRSALGRVAWDVVLSDWSLPKFSGRAALAVLGETRLDLPFIIVSGTIGEESAVEAMRAGAHDFVLKDSLARLTPAVERELREHTERAARREAEEALRVSEASLRDAVRARDEFLAIASHELRTPLTSLSLQLESARQLLDARDGTVPVEDVQARLVRASAHVSRLARLIDNLLDVTRIASGRMTFSPEVTDLRDLVEVVLLGARQALARSGSTVELSAHGPVIGEWDCLTLESAVFNLVANAITYGAGKPIEIDVAVEDDRARLVVTDHGIGIPVEQQERIFRRFERAVPEQHFGGFGLGLWVARTILEGHGGTLTVASELGAGSTFTVLLPLARKEAAVG